MSANHPQSVSVNLGDRSYDILIGHGNLDAFGSSYLERGLSTSAAIVTNPTVAALYLDPLRQSLEASAVAVTVIEMPDGEAHKTLATAESMFGDLISAGLDRGSCIITLGGGVVGDVAGFVAATYLRGIDFVQVPTTLEAQVDASVGGKTAVDHVLGKNMIGAFHQPRLVYIDTETLRSLPEREIRAGMAEVIKHGVIRDPELVTFLETHIEDLVDLSVEPELLDWLIARNCQIKSSVVAEDETEKGLREILNYGHTVGHAIEVLTDYKAYKHGEAVCLGMIAAGKIAQRKQLWEESDFDRQNELIRRLGIPKGADSLDENDLLDRMSSDKKVREGVIRFVLPDRIGHADSHDSVTLPEMNEGIRYMQGCS